MMAPSSRTRPRVQVLLDNVELTPEVSRALRRLGAEIELSSLARHVRPHGARNVDARLIVTHDSTAFLAGQQKQLFECYDHQPCATLVITMTPGETGGDNSMSSQRAIHFAAMMGEDELTGRLTAMCGLRAPIDFLHKEIAALRRRMAPERGGMNRLNDDRRMAGLVQRELLPERLPALRGAELNVLYRPAEEVSGDLYDVVRIDANTVALFVVDATGHGMAPALLASFVRNHLQLRDTTPGGPTAMDPGEALGRLNRALCRTHLSDCLFVAAVHALYDESTGIVRWARAGLSYPVVIREDGSRETLLGDGPILGMDESSAFTTHTLHLQPGDTMLLYSDGLDHLLRAEVGARGGDITETPWLHAFADTPVAKQLHQLEQLFDRAGEDRDDLTVLALTATAMPDAARLSPASDESLAAVYL